MFTFTRQCDLKDRFSEIVHSFKFLQFWAKFRLLVDFFYLSYFIITPPDLGLLYKLPTPRLIICERDFFLYVSYIWYIFYIFYTISSFKIAYPAYHVLQIVSELLSLANLRLRSGSAMLSKIDGTFTLV